MEGSGPPTQPWWTRFERTGERISPGCSAGCSIRTLEAIDCRVEYGPDGAPHRKCQRILRKFRECPGRPAEEIETAVSHSDLAEADPFLRLPPEQPDVLTPHIGEAFEEFFKIAEELSKKLAHEGEEVSAGAQQQQQPSNSNRSGDAAHGLLGRLFGRPKPTEGSERPWEQFEKSFEEV